MKIAEVVAVYPPYPGGTGYVCRHQARELARRGHDITVFTLDYGGDVVPDNAHDFPVVRLSPLLLSGGGGVVPQLCCRLRGFDVVHLHYPFFGGAEYVYLASVLRGQRYAVTYHMDVLRDTLLKRLVLPVYEPLLTRRILERASTVFALSREHLASSRAARSVSGERIVELPNGVDTEMFSPRGKDPDLVERYGLGGKTVILFVGHLIRLKGLQVLIDALAALRRDDVVVLVAGTGPEETAFKAQAKALGLERSVLFAGQQTQTVMLPAFYNACDMLVMPSVRLESFGMAALEAMASGKPVIVSSLPGPKRLVEDGRLGLLFSPDDHRDLRDKIATLISDRDLCRELGERGRRKALGAYTWQAIGGRLENALQERG